MKSISIYAVTRNQNIEQLQKTGTATIRKGVFSEKCVHGKLEKMSLKCYNQNMF